MTPTITGRESQRGTSQTRPLRAECRFGSSPPLGSRGSTDGRTIVIGIAVLRHGKSELPTLESLTATKDLRQTCEKRDTTTWRFRSENGAPDGVSFLEVRLHSDTVLIKVHPHLRAILDQPIFAVWRRWGHDDRPPPVAELRDRGPGEIRDRRLSRSERPRLGREDLEACAGPNQIYPVIAFVHGCHLVGL
jgi:hypothetical protein